MTVKMLAERRSGRLLGVQIVGREGAGKRIDIAAVALTARMTVEQMIALDLGYARRSLRSGIRCWWPRARRRRHCGSKTETDRSVDSTL